MSLLALTSFPPHTHNINIFLANLVFQDTIERVYVGDKYGDIVRGIYLIRGENVVLLGEIVSMHERQEAQTRAAITSATREKYLSIYISFIYLNIHTNSYTNTRLHLHRYTF